MNKIIILIACILAAPLALAEYCDYLTQEVEIQPGDQLPTGIPYNNERINLYDTNQTSQGHIITVSGAIESIGCEEISQPTYTVTISDQEVIQQILYSDTPLREFDRQKRQETIQIQGQSAAKQIKKTLSFAGIKVLGWFGF